MKPGDLVRYKSYPHKELRESGMTGIIVSKTQRRFEVRSTAAPSTVHVLWGHDRPRGVAGAVLEEWPDELEVINEIENE